MDDLRTLKSNWFTCLPQQYRSAKDLRTWTDSSLTQRRHHPSVSRSWSIGRKHGNGWSDLHVRSRTSFRESVNHPRYLVPCKQRYAMSCPRWRSGLGCQLYRIKSAQSIPSRAIGWDQLRWAGLKQWKRQLCFHGYDSLQEAVSYSEYRRARQNFLCA